MEKRLYGVKGGCYMEQAIYITYQFNILNLAYRYYIREKRNTRHSLELLYLVSF